MISTIRYQRREEKQEATDPQAREAKDGSKRKQKIAETDQKEQTDRGNGSKIQDLAIAGSVNNNNNKDRQASEAVVSKEEEEAKTRFNFNREKEERVLFTCDISTAYMETEYKS